MRSQLASSVAALVLLSEMSGTAFGGLSTVQEYDDYELQLELEWGQAKSPPRVDARRDSGVLYRAVGPNGADRFFCADRCDLAGRGR